MNERIRIGDQWYVAATAARAEESPHVLKHEDTFALFDRYGDAHAWGAGEQGLYHEDTRYLSRMELRIAGVRPLFLGSTVKEGNNLLIVELMNPDIVREGAVALGKGEVHVFRAKLLWDGACHEHVRLAHHGLAPARLPLSWAFGADFLDLFEVRGAARTERGELHPPQHTQDGLAFTYDGRDGRRRRMRIRLNPAPQRWDGLHAHYEVDLAPGEEVHLYCTCVCETGSTGADLVPRTVPGYDEAYCANAEARSKSLVRQCRLESSNPLMDLWLDRSASDLTMLTTRLPTGPYPYAGVPWYSTTFGRDGILTARECLWVDPRLARGVLACLAAHQARQEEPARDAEPGKILHEARKCEMARTGEVPFERYYGTVDATPLFVGLAAAYFERTGDLNFIRGLWPHVLAALEWIDRYGDLDGDGFVEYTRRSDRGLVQQGWKDSHDSVFHADGEMAEMPIALCEVQAYVYEAKCGAARLARLLGDEARAERLAAEAAELRRRFQRAFWCEDLGTYAIALDGRKRPCRVATSNGGHCLWSGIAAPEHARRMAERFMQPDFFSGWGVRTVAAGQPRYNPMSYHNGSIWPHDNALLAVGFARYGHTEAALRLLTGMFEASLHFSQHRLPELFCGFPRRAGEGPTLYPVACSPQAWAAAAVFALLQACLGIEIDATDGQLGFRAPRLPEFIDWMELRDLQICDAKVDLLLQRYHHNVGVEVVRKEGNIEVRVAV